MTVETGLVNADLRRKRSVDLAQVIQARYGDDVTRLRVGLLAHPYPHPVPDRHRSEVEVTALRGGSGLVLVASTAPDDEAPAAGVGIWELTVATRDGTVLPRGEAEGWARALFGYRCAPLVYRRPSGGGLFRRPSRVDFVVHHGEHGPMHPSDVEAFGACA
ncbi:hypothetical protein Ae168Ps1_0362 [Pseudonocardia sp. Ae168_Ps1]|uniref:hypothetical protein n=1 Tax=unclassified Pseudonocardia TaxID=2619320 RepID=UPI0001FFE400|nr:MULTISPECIES: hypothetical protein [unclassified Pseudonocardia]ALE73494.1 hypothetical protein FRP1_11235 [Pseudonocardia sp. EC080625-04]ALL76984.1 hypothetical protein AD006_19725 [Pseudonocardia sp. EC080610-09]ALL84015.1 hypothetical protein AD017_27565 [Pseudonocardia sp. EC080619-01]OLL71989.1 hypothetical protein Ae150APs1_0367 [Pseudonocardia sp. Ae150A_Ps1]OLL77956.1 hypothetical protein Ae168Ps1_0362 [Pseudonocardia sp. Ae168_Ps1]